MTGDGFLHLGWHSVILLFSQSSFNYESVYMSSVDTPLVQENIDSFGLNQGHQLD